MWLWHWWVLVLIGSVGTNVVLCVYCRGFPLVPEALR